LHTEWKLYSEEEIVLVVGKVRHSYAATKDPLKPWVLIKCSGAVLVGHCTCMAGLAKFSIFVTPIKPCRELLIQQLWWLMYRDSFEKTEKVK